MTLSEFKQMTRAVVLALRKELTPNNKDVLSKLSEADEKLAYDGKPLIHISEEPDNNLCQKQDGLYAMNAYVTTESSPVGEIIAFMGTIVPEHYLICDGSVYNITDYPKLAQHFADNFGSVNHFGGDGTTTFAVPDLRGEFLRGNADNGISGTHQEPTMIPYTDTIVMGNGVTWIRSYLPSVEDNKVVSGSNYDKTTKAYAVNQVESIKNTDSWVESGNFPAKVATRPTNTSVLYCIKCEPTMTDPDGGSEEVGGQLEPALTEDEMTEIVEYILAFDENSETDEQEETEV